MPLSIWMFVKEIQQLSNRDQEEYILYYVHNTRFQLLGDIFLMQLKSIYNKYQEGYTTICQLFENLVFCLLYLILYKNQQFVIYIEKYILVKITKEIKKLISSFRLRKQAIDIFLESFESFLYVKIDREYQRHGFSLDF